MAAADPSPHSLRKLLARLGRDRRLPADPQSGVPGASEGVPPDLVEFIKTMMSRMADGPTIADIHGFNQLERDKWVRKTLATLPGGTHVLDVGAGTCLYRPDLAHCRYESHDFKQYEGFIDPSRQEGLYGQIDHVSDILHLPVPDGSFDAVLCTEVLEHVPEPIAAVGEMARALGPGGRMILTAPLGSGLHQEPHHYYGGYTPHWYRMVAERFALVVEEITPNGGFFKHLAQECARVAWTMDGHRPAHAGLDGAVGLLFGELLPRYLFSIDGQYPMPEFAIGFHVVLA